MPSYIKRTTAFKTLIVQRQLQGAKTSYYLNPIAEIFDFGFSRLVEPTCW